MTVKTTEFAAKITGDANGAIAALEQVKARVQETARASESANTKVGSTTDVLIKSSEKAARGIAAVTQALYAMEAQGSARVLALGSAVGNFADLLGPAGKVVSGIAIVTSSIAALFLQAQERSREATRAIEADIRRLAAAGDVGGLAKKQQQIFSGDRLFDDPNAKGNKVLTERQDLIRNGGLQRIQRELAVFLPELNKLPPALSEGGAAIEAFNKAREKVQAQAYPLQQAEALLRGEYEETTKELELLTAAAVERDKTANKRIADEERTRQALQDRKKLEAELLSLQREEAALLAKLSNLSPYQADAKAVESLAQKWRAAGVPAAEITKRVEVLNAALEKGRAAEQAAEFEKFAQSLRDRAGALGDALRIEQERIDVEQQSARTAAERLSFLEKEARLLGISTEAADKYVQQKLREDAVDRARATAAKEQGASDFSIAAAGNIAGRAFDAAAAVERLRSGLKAATADNLATQLAEVAQSATQIATSLGDAGKNLARVAAIAGPLLSGVGGLQNALLKRDDKGNVVKGGVGLFTALSGKNGSDSQAKALAGSVAILGAVAGIADSLDLFGTRAKQRAAEMKEAARAFAIALQDFVAAANPTTGATAAIETARKRAEELAKESNRVSGGRAINFDNGVTVESLRALANQRRAEAAAADAKNGGIGDTLAVSLRAIAKGFDDVADSLVQVEAAARAQVLANIEDLGVRRLQAAGQTEAAAALAAELQARRAVTAASRDTTEEGRAYYRALQEITAAEVAAAAASRARAAVLQRIEDDNALLGGTDSQRLQRSIAGLVESFPDLFAGAFDGLDFSTSEGLTRAKEIIKGFYLQLAADGVSEAERPIVDFLKRLFGDIDNAIGNLPDVLEPLAKQLEGFGERVKLFGLTLTEQLRELKVIFGGKFGAAFDEILKGADLGTATGRAEFKNRLQQQVSEILADGVITDAERPYYNALVQFLGLVNEALDDAAAEAEAAAATAAAARADRRSASGTRVSLFDLDGEAAVREQLRGFGSAFSELFAQFDLGSLAGVDGAKDVLRGIFEQLESLSDEEMLARFGLTRDELVTAILDADNGFDSLRSTLLSTADAAMAAAAASKEFTESIGDEYLRNTGRGQEADITAAQRRRDDRIKKAQELGLGQSILDQIEGIYQGDLREIAARYAEAAGVAAPASTASSTGASAGSTRSRARNTSVVSDFGGLSEVTGQSLAGLLREVAINTGDRGAIVAALVRGMTSGITPISSLSFPSYPTGGGGGVVISGNTFEITIGSLNPGGLSPNEAATMTVEAIARKLGSKSVAEVRYLGGAKRS